MVSAREQILEVIRELVAPLVRADGGEIYIVSADDAGVALHVTGRYAGCPGNTLARRRVIEPLIVKRVPGARVMLSSGPLLPKGAERA
jgi:Fe-S cluster biogenesis protein NfuA